MHNTSRTLPKPSTESHMQVIRHPLCTNCNWYFRGLPLLSSSQYFGHWPHGAGSIIHSRVQLYCHPFGWCYVVALRAEHDSGREGHQRPLYHFPSLLNGHRPLYSQSTTSASPSTIENPPHRQRQSQQHQLLRSCYLIIIRTIFHFNATLRASSFTFLCHRA